MIDIRLLREKPAVIRQNMLKRGFKFDLDGLIKKDKEWRHHLKRLEELRHQKNVITEEISKTKEKRNITKVRELSEHIKNTEEEVNKLRLEIDAAMMKLPNILHPSVPKGNDEKYNKVLRKWGTPPKFKFKPLGHEELMEKLNLGDMERAAKISGSRFYFLKNELAIMDFGLMFFAIDQLTRKGYQFLYPPLMMRRKPYEGVVDLNDFENVMYKIQDEDLYLIATSEHPLVSMHMNEILDEKQLPIRYVGWSTNFRKEAGSHGKDTKGIFRTHHFNKIEQVVFSKPEESWEIFDELVKNKEEIVKKLEIPYRVVSICSGELGSIAAKKIDIEGWMPAQKEYRELTSASNCTDYQARRLGIRYGLEGKKTTGYPHILNSTAIATGRMMVAILENNQQADGSVKIPSALVPFMGGLKKISPRIEIPEKKDKKGKKKRK